MDHPQATPIIIISRSRLFRSGLRSLLDGSRYEAVQEIEDVQQVERLRRDGDPGVILLDAGHDLACLTDGVRHLIAQVPEMPVVVISDILDWQHLIDTLSAGASGYLLTEISTEALVSSLRLVEYGEKVFPTHMAALLLKGTRAVQPQKGDPFQVRGLSTREAQILRHLVDGDSNKMIARSLGVTEATIKVHMKSLLRKIKCANRTQAAVWALNHGMDDTDEDDDEDGRHATPRIASAPRPADAPPYETGTP